MTHSFSHDATLCRRCHIEGHVKDSRPHEKGRRRRRRCPKCGTTWSTYEISAEQIDDLPTRTADELATLAAMLRRAANRMDTLRGRQSQDTVMRRTKPLPIEAPMDQPKWIPHEFLDEVVPEPRENPSDWIVKQPDGSLTLASGDITNPDGAGPALVDGQIVLFDSTFQNLGISVLKIQREGNGRTWSLSPAAPEVPPGYQLQIAGTGDWETMEYSVEDFVTAYPGTLPDEIEVIFYAWSKEPTAFRLLDGAFVAAQEVKGNA